jgi:putative transposase
VPQAVACRALGVSQSWFYKWRDGDASPRHARREQLAVAVRRLFAAHKGTHGSPRIAADLREEGWRVSVNTVAGIMAELGLAGRRQKQRKQTTRQGRGRWRAEDLVHRSFSADAPDELWFGDGTEIVTDEGKLYLDSVLDIASRRIVGYALGEHHDADLSVAALQMAVAVRGGREHVKGVVFHSDQGSEGGFNRSSQHLDDGGVWWRIRGSRGRGVRRARGGSGQRIVRCGRRCGRRAGRSRLGRCNARSGG